MCTTHTRHPAALSSNILGLPLVRTVLLVAVSQLAYPWFHALAELFTVVVGIAALQLLHGKETTNASLRRALILVMTLGAATELCLTWYVLMYGFSNMVGHVLKLWAYWVMLLVISQYMLMRPKERLKEQAELLENLVGQIPGITCVLRLRRDGSYAMPFVSPGIVGMLELTTQEVAEDASPMWGRIVREDRERVASAIEACFAERVALNATWEVLLPQKGRRWQQGNSSVPVLQADGAGADPAP